jgi:flagellar basal body-associated protein FliL
MEKKYKIIIILLVVALVFFTLAIIIKAYFPELRVGGANAVGSATPSGGGSVQIFVQKPAPAGA